MIKFPIHAEYKNDPEQFGKFIVLFTGMGVGTVVWADKNKKNWKIGHHSCNWTHITNTDCWKILPNYNRPRRSETDLKKANWQ